MFHDTYCYFYNDDFDNNYIFVYDHSIKKLIYILELKIYLKKNIYFF